MTLPECPPESLSENLPATLYDAATRAAEAFGDRDFLVIGRREEVLGFAELANRADRFGRLLASLGVIPGDRVGMWMTNQAAWAVSAYGIARAGAVMVGISTRLSAREVAHLIELSRPAVLVTEDRFLGKIDAAGLLAEIAAMLAQRGVEMPRVVMRLSGDGALPEGALDWEQAMAAAADLPPLAPAAELVARAGEHGHAELAGVAAILSTSGTTGAPKGVMLTHAGLCRLAHECTRRQELDPSQRFYSIAPFFHCSGYMHALLTNLLAGSTLFATRKYDAEEAWDVITGEGIDAYHGFIGVLQDMADAPGRDYAKLRMNRAWYSAPAARMKRLEEILGVSMCEVYGLTETGGNVAICRRDDPEEMRHDSDGRPQDGLAVRIVDPASGAVLPEGAQGEICVNGWNVMRGYFRDPAATAKAIDAEGYLHTGDQGVLLPGGYLRFVSRIKDIIRVGGENLSPIEVEEVLVDHPDVAEVAVVAAPDPRLSEVPVAFVILRPGTGASEKDLDAYARRHLANFKVPRRFFVVDSFPRTGATNRVQKAKLRDMIPDMADA
ncbi:MAG: AMP-binding protein [Azospirillaceae bacterium]